MLKQAFGDNSLGQTQTYDWYKRVNIFRELLDRTTYIDDAVSAQRTGIPGRLV
jgi:hypothetical protein